MNAPPAAGALLPGLPDPLLDGSVKGWPALGARASEIAPGELTLEDLPTPVLYLREEPLSANIAALARWCEQHAILLAPHAKTTMAPALLARQLDAGAWGLTVADVRQARVALASAAPRVLIANELARAADLHWLAAFGVAAAAGEVPGARISFCLDSIAGLELAEDAHRRCGGPPLRALVELGYADGRCGVRDDGDALALARAVAGSPHVALCGIETYEGLMPVSPGDGGDADGGVLARVDELLQRAARLAERAAPLVEDDEPILTAGGSAYFDRVAALLREPCDRLGWRLCLRSGCYITHDHGLYAGMTPSNRDAGAPRFQPAIEVRASVLSRPQPDKLILDCGRRDVPYDAGLPVVLEPPAAPGAGAMALTQLNDEHAHVAVSRECDIAAGATLTLGISHPCTALERWRVLALVDRSDRVLAALPTCF